MTNSAISEVLYFDARYIRVDHHDGISRFSVGLCNEISKQTKTIAIICDEQQLKFLPSQIEYIKLNKPTDVLPELFIAKKLNKLGAKLVYSPMQTMGTSGRKFKLLLTLHDLIYYRHPAPPPSLSLPIRIGWRLFHTVYWPQRLVLNGADAIVTVSETSKRLIQEFRLTKRQVHVVYNAAEYVHTPNQSARNRPVGKQKLVYMGSFMDYKNVETLITGMQWLTNYELHLLSRISSERKAQLVSLAESVGANVVFHDGVSDSEYLDHLDQAVALVTASRDEGFGIPVIEAMGRGCPAIISSIEIFKEIGDEAALFFETNSPESFAQAVRSIETEANWKHASDRSIAQANKFSWKESADQLLAAIKSLY